MEKHFLCLGPRPLEKLKALLNGVLLKLKL